MFSVEQLVANVLFDTLRAGQENREMFPSAFAKRHAIADFYDGIQSFCDDVTNLCYDNKRTYAHYLPTVVMSAFRRVQPETDKLLSACVNSFDVFSLLVMWAFENSHVQGGYPILRDGLRLILLDHVDVNLLVLKERSATYLES